MHTESAFLPRKFDQDKAGFFRLFIGYIFDANSIFILSDANYCIE